ncbi:MAG: hypothetical protein GF310_08765 [candidate division Zixibacteria bacterium]|nr:hypothetical protein [candidate division Zixibacteria bacterium]
MRKPISDIKICLIALALILATTTAIPAESDYEQFLSKRISLSVEESPIEDVVRLLARQNGFNFSISGENLGQVSFILDDVPLSEALNAILNPNGLTWYLRENVVVIKDNQTLAVDEIETVIYDLKYVSANEAKLAGAHLLSKAGHMEILSEDVNVVERPTPTSLVISDRRDNIKEILRVLGRLDRPAPQLNIAVKLIETNINNDDNLGIDWPESYSGTLGGLLDEETGLTHLGVYPLEGGDWVWGKFSANEVRLALDVLMKRRDSRLLSDPNITTISNKPAEIAVTTTIPIQTVNRFTEGAVIQDIVTFQELDVGITLRVTGRINEDSIITLKVNPIIEEITGYTGPADNQRPITSNRSMFTEVRVNNNETLVMGGLLRESTFENVKKLPLLGSIPGIGLLFQHHSTQKEKTDLTIFITPRIIDESMAQR